MTSNRESIIQKIAKCMALSKSSNSNEAAIALRQAQKLMEQYGIDEKEITLTNIKELEFIVRESNICPPSWHITLGALCAEAFNCDMFVNHTYNKTTFKSCKAFVFIGLQEHLNLAKYCYDVLYRQLITATQKYQKGIKSRGEKGGIRILNSFRKGWVSEVHTKLIQLKREEERNEPPTDSKKNAIVLIKNTVSLYLEEKYPDLKPIKDRADIDHHAYLQGLAEGKKADLHNPINKKNNVLMLN